MIYTPNFFTQHTERPVLALPPHSFLYETFRRFRRLDLVA
jgi:hypothetical protein